MTTNHQEESLKESRPMSLTIKQIHDEITENMVNSYPRNIEEETAKRAIEFKRIFKREYGTEWRSY